MWNRDLGEICLYKGGTRSCTCTRGELSLNEGEFVVERGEVVVDLEGKSMFNQPKKSLR